MAPKYPRSRGLNLAYPYTQSVANITFSWRPGLIGYLKGALGIVNCLLQLFFVACGNLLQRRPFLDRRRSTLVAITVNSEYRPATATSLRAIASQPLSERMRILWRSKCRADASADRTGLPANVSPENVRHHWATTL